MAERYSRKRRFGDRQDGRKLRNVSSGERLTPFFLNTRLNAVRTMAESAEISTADAWLQDLSRRGNRKITMLHVVLAAYARTVSYCPGFNRFVAGQRIFARNNIEVILSGAALDKDETSSRFIKVNLDPDDTVFDVYRKINDRIDRMKADYETRSRDQLTDMFIRLPRFLLRIGSGLIRLLDYFGLISPALLQLSPYHGSLRIGDNAELGLPPFTPTLSNFGNVSLSVSMGKPRSTMELEKSGSMKRRRYLDYNVAMDSRVCNEIYMAAALKYWKFFISNPAELEHPPKRVLDDEM